MTTALNRLSPNPAVTSLFHPRQAILSETTPIKNPMFSDSIVIRTKTAFTMKAMALQFA